MLDRDTRYAVIVVSVCTRTKHFHSRFVLRVGMLDRDVKYAAIAEDEGVVFVWCRIVVVVDGGAGAVRRGSCSCSSSSAAIQINTRTRTRTRTRTQRHEQSNRSALSFAGVALPTPTVAFCPRQPPVPCQYALPDIGDTSRDSVFRNVDLRFSGMGSVARLMASSGSLRLGWLLRSLRSSSTSSIAGGAVRWGFGTGGGGGFGGAVDDDGDGGVKMKVKTDIDMMREQEEEGGRDEDNGPVIVKGPNQKNKACALTNLIQLRLGQHPSPTQKSQQKPPKQKHPALHIDIDDTKSDPETDR
ncbi:hypothetical protein CVT25_010179 [Psilocybe cyanescens]|uniref:Uncharacterized protein n=1 Tax=Psilocybe cyanescens TaxID=93625 RepID=A0A409XQ93_PSICY|nr:hypothetical protein CVT25_010179 [Psilocybe cyanescens]